MCPVKSVIPIRAYRFIEFPREDGVNFSSLIDITHFRKQTADTAEAYRADRKSLFHRHVDDADLTMFPGPPTHLAITSANYQHEETRVKRKRHEIAAGDHSEHRHFTPSGFREPLRELVECKARGRSL